MQFDILEQSWLFRGLSAHQIQSLLSDIPYFTQNYEKDETIFYPLEMAGRIGVILRGKVQSYKLFPNGNQVAACSITAA